MSVYLDFKYLQGDVLSNMIFTYCLDAYASQLWEYEDKRFEKYYVARRKAHGDEAACLIVYKLVVCIDIE